MDKKIESYLLKNKPVVCENCNSRLFYTGIGEYKCKECDEIYLDDYGKVRHFVEENGPMQAILISQATGVDEEVISAMLYNGKVEIPEGSKYYLQCEKCGSSLRYGRICPLCARNLSNGMRNFDRSEVGEIPKSETSDYKKGKMHFIGRK